MIYEDVNDLYIDILRKVRKGNIVGKRREKIFLTFTLIDLDKNILFFPFAQRNWPWILRECSDRISGIDNPGVAWQFSKNWENRIEDTGYFSYHYSNRLNDQMKNALSSRIQSRDKIIQVWDEKDYYMKGRQPCTITMQVVMEEDKKLSLVVYMRNNDVINILPSDIFIHSTYFKYWTTYYGYEYKNLYWVAAVAYYQKKRDELNFIKRLIDQWAKNYNSVSVTKWNSKIINDYHLKEQYEQKGVEYWKDKFKNKLFKSSYIDEWFKIMLLARFKMANMKDEYRELYNMSFDTEFSFIKEKMPQI